MAKKEKNKYSGYAEKSKYGRDPFYYILGIILIGVGVLLIFQNTLVTTSWYSWRVGSFFLPTGVCVVPLLIGIGMLFYNHKSVVAKIVLGIGAVFLLLTIILSVRFSFVYTSLLNYILMVGCLVAGIGLFLRGLLRRPKD